MENISMSGEEWRAINGYNGRYKISNFGRVLSVERKVSNGTGIITIPTKILKQSLNYKGYPITYLSKNAKCKTVAVHRLVAIAFISNFENKPQVNHIDGNKQNNNVDNLEWCTNGENQIHAYKIGLNYVTGKAGKPKRAVIQVDMKTGKYLNEYSSVAEATAAIGFVSKSNIGACCRGIKKSVGGYKWIYKEESEVM